MLSEETYLCWINVDDCEGGSDKEFATQGEHQNQNLTVHDVGEERDRKATQAGSQHVGAGNGLSTAIVKQNDGQNVRGTFDESGSCKVNE